MAKKTKKQVQQSTETVVTAEMQEPLELAPPITPIYATGAVRRAVESGHPLDYSPAAVIRIMHGAQSGRNLQDMCAMGMTVLRRNIRLRSAMSSRVLAVAGLKLSLEDGGTSRKSRKAYEACQALIATPAMKKLVRHLAWGSYFGWAGAQVVYAEGVESWPIQDFKVLQPGWFVFDPTDGETPLLLPTREGDMPEALEPPGRYVFHAPQLLPGAPWLNGIMYTAVFYAVLLHIVLKQGTQFVELYNQALRIGHYPQGETPQLKQGRAALKKALEHLGTDAWAMLPDGVQIEFVKDANVGDSVESYERWSRYFDELLTQLAQWSSLTSSTSNTGGGGSLAQGKVHEDSFIRGVNAEGAEIADTITRDVLTPFVRFNFGPDVEVPLLRMASEKAEDAEAKMRATKIFWEMGGTLSAEEARDYLGWREPEKGEATLGRGAGAEAEGDTEKGDGPGKAKAKPDAKGDDEAEGDTDDTALTVKLSATPASAPEPDELDRVVDALAASASYRDACDAQDAALLSLIERTPAADLIAALEAHILEHDTSAYSEAIAGALLAAEAAGELEVNIGGD